MIDHVGLAVSDIGRARVFYEAALAPLGLQCGAEIGPELTKSGSTALGFGADDKWFFWIADHGQPGQGSHVAFTAKSRSAVESFHTAALAAGGSDNGGPGLRPHYGPGYYAAFVLDPDGINVEAVFREPAA